MDPDQRNHIISYHAILHSVHEYWFRGVVQDPSLLGDCRERWFQSGHSRDAEIRERFGGLPEQFQDVAPEAFAEPKFLLSALLVLDQFPRHLFRGSAQAFAFDAATCQLALHALRQGWEQQLTEIEDVFLLMPLQHTESLDEQVLCVEHYRALLKQARPEFREILEQSVEAAEKHRDIIAQFGRFPHRNAALGREPTDAETQWLAAGGERFGQ